jgi:hypothetical protein
MLTPERTFEVMRNEFEHFQRIYRQRRPHLLDRVGPDYEWEPVQEEWIMWQNAWIAGQKALMNGSLS